MKEAFKLVVFPHGKIEVAPGQFAFKYILGGVLLSDKEFEMPSETLMMDENFSGALSAVLRDGKKFTVSHPLGSLDSAIMMLGCFTPDHHNVTEYLTYYIENDDTASDDCFYICCNGKPEFSEMIGPSYDRAEARCKELNDSRRQ